MSEESELTELSHMRRKDMPESNEAPLKTAAKSCEPSQWEQIVIATGIVANILTVVGIVAMNKHIQTNHGFPFMVSLSAMHFIFTSIALRAMLGCGIFEYKSAALKYVVSKAALDCASVSFMNINLSHNSVGTYQLSKLCCIPVTVAVQYLYWGTGISANTAHALLSLCVGIGISTVNDVHVTMQGALWATAAIFATVLSQLVTNLYLRHLGCDALQLLYHTAPWISVGMLAMVPLLEDHHVSAPLTSYAASLPAVIDILISCALALAVNVTNYLVLGKTSALTFQVAGHFKTLLTLVIGYTVFDRAAAPKNLVGVAIALAGMTAYMHVRHEEAAGRRGRAGAAVVACYLVVAGAGATWPYLPDVVFV